MGLKNINFKCPDCENGVVTITTKITQGDLCTTIAKRCNSCRKFFGIKATLHLQPISLNKS